MARIFDSEFKPSVDRPGSDSNVSDLKHDGSSAAAHAKGLLSDLGHLFKDGIVDPVVAGTSFVGHGLDNLGDEAWAGATKVATTAARYGAAGVHTVKEFGSDVYEGASEAVDKVSSAAHKTFEFGKDEVTSIGDHANNCVDNIKARADNHGDVSLRDVARGLGECTKENIANDPALNKLGDMKVNLGDAKIHIGDKNDALKKVLEESTHDQATDAKPEKVTTLAPADAIVTPSVSAGPKSLDLSAGMSM